MKTEIIVVCYKQPHFEKITINSVIDNTKDFKLTVIDNSIDNFWLSKLWNKLIRQSDSEYICLLNSDTVVTPNWITNLEKFLDEDSRTGAVMPMSNHVGLESARVQIPFPRHSENFEEIYKVNTGQVGSCISENLSAFCLLIRKKAWEEIGGFDEEFQFYGEDTDFTVRLHKAGLKLIIDRETYVHHYGGTSASAANNDPSNPFNQIELTQKARQMFKEKNITETLALKKEISSKHEYRLPFKKMLSVLNNITAKRCQFHFFK